MTELNTVFSPYKGKNIVLYGLGSETAKALEQMSGDFNIVGLLDGVKTEGFLYGKPILALNQCAKEKTELIIAAARPGSCKAIAKRIGGFCRENSIELTDTHGNNLLLNQKKYYDYDELIRIVRTSADMDAAEEIKTKLKLFEDRLSELQNGNTAKSSSVCIRDAFDIGYLFCGPVIADFLIWFRMMVKKKKLKNVWFCARDGYLLHELYRLIDEEQRGRYFLTSRMAAVRSCVEAEEDIADIDSMRFSGTTEEHLLKRFGIHADEKAADGIKEGILQYEGLILKKAANRRDGYRKYLESMDIQPGGIAFFDFVAKGTTQYFISRLVENHMTGLYFLQLDPEFMKNKNLDIISFYSGEELEHSSIFENYYILETFLTSASPSVAEFDRKGLPVYSKELRSAGAIACSERIQLGIKEYFKRYTEQCGDLERSVSKAFDGQLLRLIHHVEIKDAEFLNFIIEDPFFNRMTNITDVL
ncbi:MAG: hypothetical protein LUH21_26740 [Clostridiales bacterium]|nr:hypothetical protein [Clostridiales bacterium]